MRIHITLDDLPEFESFHSLWLAIRGASWSITNTPLGEPLSVEIAEKLLAALQAIEELLRPVVTEEVPWLADRRAGRQKYIWEGIAVGDQHPTPQSVL